MRQQGLSILLLGLLAVSTPLADAYADVAAPGPRILHLPPQRQRAEQGILTPIPVELELPQVLAAHAERVLVHYKLRGEPSWTTLELQASGSRWEGAIPCLEVSTITGNVVYYIRVHDSEGRVIAYSGTRSSPYRIAIVHDTAKTEATLERPRCPDPADCPAGLPGCPSAIVEKIPCQSDRDCEGEMSCGWDGFCELDTRRHTWVGLELSQDFGWIDTTGACTLASQETEGTLCLRRFDDAVYYGSPSYTNEPRKMGVGNGRIGVGVEHLIHYDASLRLRVAYSVTGEGPTAPGGVSFVPVSAEIGVVHWFGTDPFATRAWRPFVSIGFGYGMFDIESSSHVRADLSRHDPQGGNDLDQTVDVYKRAGDLFISLGAGVLVASTSGWALRPELSVAKAFPFSAVIITPRLAFQKGF